MVTFARLFIVLSLLSWTQAQTVSHVCTQKYTTIKDVRRSTANIFDPAKDDVNQLICDRFFIKDGTWYRFQSVAGNEMPTNNPGFYRCSTYAPIWMNGKHPTIQDGIVSRTACVNLPHVAPAGCGVHYDIKVVNCDGFYLYQLKEPGQCYFAYCAGSKLPKDCSTTGDTLPVCPGIVPKMDALEAGVKDEKTVVRLRCSWKYKGNPKVEFHVRWFGDEKDTSPKIEQKFFNSKTREYLFEWENPDLFGVPRNKNGYKLGKQVYCQIRAKYKDGDWSKWITSNKLFTGITVYPQFITMNECTNDKREVTVTLRPHLPIRGELQVTLAYPGQDSVINALCVRGSKSLRSCGITFKDHPQGTPIRFKIMTTCLRQNLMQQNKQQESLTYTLRSRTNFKDPFWNTFQFPPIKILKLNNNKRKCSSTGDPHFRTFDGRIHHFMGRGTFVLYRHDGFGTEIQTRQKACNSNSSPSCNCGVAIKEQAFYRIYDLCTEDGSSAWWKGNQIIKIRKRYIRDHTLNRFYTNTKPGQSKTTYEVNLPSGVAVTIQRMMWGLNTYVRAPVDKKQLSKGLCGNNNGNPNDDLDGKSTNNFGESWRVPDDHTNLFYYKGDKEAEEKIDDRCDEEICLCKSNRVKVCGVGAIRECFPEQDPGNTKKNSGIGRCPNERRKRSLASRDDSVDDQDDIPSFNPPSSNISFTPTWPTPRRGLTLTNVTDFCNKKLRYSKAGESCGKITGVDIDALVDQCVADIQMTEDFKWSSGNFAALESTCKSNVYSNASLYKNTTDGKLELATEMLASLCPNDCSDHGTCLNSTCICDEDYTSDDCSLSLQDSPVLTGIQKSGLCDLRRRPCRTIGIYGYPFMDTKNLTCHIHEYKVIESAWIPKSSTSLYPGELSDLTEVKCALPASPVNIGDYDNQGITAAGLKISVSNNRVNDSAATMLFISYDSVCQECNTTTGCKLKANACYISGHCFAQNQSHPRDWCQQCLSETSTTAWTKRKDNQEPTFQTSNSLYAFFGKTLRVQLRAEDPEKRRFKFAFAKNTTSSASLTANGLFTWTPMTNSSTLFLFKVVDECGASSILNATVVMKQCPCNNAGTCQPDSRDLEGKGNFTCQCKPDYNGTLCELDVNECLTSPCFNGTCINKRPGFSCACNPGYTGTLCDIEIDECLSSPCFLDVQCHDMVNGYRCGPCPNGYTGSGKNCSRIDGNIDECVRSPGICAKHAKCAYSNGSYSCQCENGYSGDGRGNCSDVDECSQSPSVCHPHATCTNTKGAYVCKCTSGYNGDGKLNCTDIDECSHSPNVCHSHANCTNTQGAYVCQCTSGYAGDGKYNCTDIDECTQSPAVCHEHAKCTNTAGSYSCQCETGYAGDPHVNCTDINECILKPSVCHQHAHCVNAEGSFSCRCANGYVGDGKVSCSENVRPRFTSPATVYALFNQTFQIQVRAEDPESQSLRYSLLPNGTIKNVRVSEDGLLNVVNINETGNVTVRVEDEHGGQNTLSLHIIAMKCPCMNGGGCFLRKSVVYPRTPSDYQCRCESPFTGALCESRYDPCDEFPCFLGLKCFSSNNSEEFRCEECPELFKGDGKNCELESSPEMTSHKSEITLKDREWKDELSNKDSRSYKKLVSEVIIEINNIYTGQVGFSYVIVLGLRKGSVVVELELIFTTEVDNPLAPLREVAKNGKLGNMTIEMKKPADDSKPDKDEKILGLAKFTFIVIAAAAALLLVMVIFVVCCLVKRKTAHGHVKLSKGRAGVGSQSSQSNNAPGVTSKRETDERRLRKLKVYLRSVTYNGCEGPLEFPSLTDLYQDTILPNEFPCDTMNQSRKNCCAPTAFLIACCFNRRYPVTTRRRTSRNSRTKIPIRRDPVQSTTTTVLPSTTGASMFSGKIGAVSSAEHPSSKITEKQDGLITSAVTSSNNLHNEASSKCHLETGCERNGEDSVRATGIKNDDRIPKKSGQYMEGSLNFEMISNCTASLAKISTLSQLTQTISRYTGVEIHKAETPNETGVTHKIIWERKDNNRDPNDRIGDKPGSCGAKSIGNVRHVSDIKTKQKIGSADEKDCSPQLEKPLEHAETEKCVRRGKQFEKPVSKSQDIGKVANSNSSISSEMMFWPKSEPVGESEEKSANPNKCPPQSIVTEKRKDCNSETCLRRYQYQQPQTNSENKDIKCLERASEETILKEYQKKANDTVNTRPAARPVRQPVQQRYDKNDKQFGVN